MWLIPAILCVIYVETYQQDLVIPPFLKKYAGGYPSGNNGYFLSSRYDVQVNDLYKPYDASNGITLPKLEARTSEDLARLNYLIKKHEEAMRELVKANDLTYDEIPYYKNKNPLISADNSHKVNIYKPKAPIDGHSYYDDLDLVLHFGNYLKQKTETSSPFDADAGRQFNALLVVLIALAKIIRNTCTDVDGVYDMVYLPTVDKFYEYGLNNADRVVGGIDEYIRRGNARIAKLLKLKEEQCDEYPSCAAAVDEQVKTNFVIYSKEIETLESLVYLAQSFLDFSKEFNNAAVTGTVLPYLQNNKDRIKEYIWNVVATVDHISDKTITCP